MERAVNMRMGHWRERQDSLYRLYSWGLWECCT